MTESISIYYDMILPLKGLTRQTTQEIKNVKISVEFEIECERSHRQNKQSLK